MEGFLEEEVQGGPLGQGRDCASQAGNTGQRHSAALLGLSSLHPCLRHILG